MLHRRRSLALNLVLVCCMLGLLTDTTGAIQAANKVQLVESIKPPEAPYEPGELIIKINPNVQLAELTSKIDRALQIDQKPFSKATTANKYLLTPLYLAPEKNPSVFLFKGEEETVQKIIPSLTADSDIAYVERNFILFVQAVPNDPGFQQQWSLNNTGQIGGGVIGTDIDAIGAWDQQVGSADMTVAVLDTGVSFNHPDLADIFWANPLEILNGVDDDHNGLIDDLRGWNYINNNNNPVDGYGHGTHVSGIIAAKRNNNLGIAGICGGDAAISQPGCTIMPLRVCNDSGSCNVVMIANAIRYAADPDNNPATRDGAQIINLSLGSNYYTQTEQDAVNFAHAQDVLVIAAAGNNGSSVKFYPAAYEHVIAVAGTNGADLKSSSNYGTWVDISAPGQEIYSTWINDGYRYQTGTSMAAPLVSGVAALLRINYPTWTNDQIAALLVSSGEHIDEHNPEYLGLLGITRVNALSPLLNPTALNLSLTAPIYGATYNNNFIDQNGTIYGFDGTDTQPSTVITRRYGIGSAPTTWTTSNLYNYQDPTLGFGYLRATSLSDGTYTLAVRLTASSDATRYVEKFAPITLSRTAAYQNQTNWPVTIPYVSFNSSPLVMDPNPALPALRQSHVFIGATSYLYGYDASGKALPNWPVALSGTWQGSPAAADIDNDGSKEIVFTSMQGKVACLKINGTMCSGWETPKQVGSLPFNSAVIADLQQDGQYEIIVGDSNGLVTVWQNDGTVLYTVMIDPMVHSTPAVADVNFDGILDIVAATTSKYVYLIHLHSNSAIIGTTTGIPYGSPVIADIDENNFQEIIVASYNSGTEGYVEVFNTTGAHLWTKPVSASLYDVAVGILSGLQWGDVVAADTAGHIYRWRYDGSGGLLYTADSGFANQPLITDMDGDNQREIVAVSQTGKVFVVKTNGSLLIDPPPQIGPVQYSSPQLKDLDMDGDLDMVVAGTDGKINVLDFKVRANTFNDAWTRYRGNETNDGLYLFPTMTGDVNLNGRTNEMDAYHILQHVNGLTLLAPDRQPLAAKMAAPFDQITEDDATAALQCSLSQYGSQMPYCQKW